MEDTILYFMCPDNKKASGGVKQIYRQVDILNKNGFNAYVLHKKKGFRANWFLNNTKIKYNPTIFRNLKYQIKKQKNDSLFLKLIFNINTFLDNFLSSTNRDLDKNGILIIPEIYGAFVDSIEPNIKKVIFNQNCYYTFNNYSIDYFFKNQTVLATIIASIDGKNYLDFTYPSSINYRIRLGIDKNIFNYGAIKKKQIAFMPRKLNEDVIQIINILKSRNSLNDWKLIPIDKKSENEVAQILKESLIFLSFNYREGFGLPPAEAMACGCFVIGYAGRGGEEYFKPEFSSKVEDRNIVEFVKQIEFSISEYEKKAENLLIKGKIASDFILDEYSLENENNDIIKVWTDILL